MKIQIDNGKLTYFSRGLTIGSTVPLTEEIEAHMNALVEYCLTQRTPEQVATEMAETKRLLAVEQKEQAKEQERKARVREAEAVGSLVTALKLIRIDELTPEELADIIGLYPEYRTDWEYTTDDLFQFEGKLYRVVQDHTSQEDWRPDELPALYTSIAPENIIAEWVQPLGAHDAYNRDDQVLFNGEIWISIVDGNTWQPGVHGWEKYHI